IFNIFQIRFKYGLFLLRVALQSTHYPLNQSQSELGVVLTSAQLLRKKQTTCSPHSTTQDEASQASFFTLK
ncbi:MAG: hypothetical protein O7D30_04945, partial [Rickettsia endosymbiont of Ixodes persulcatus]|nr:hypothetical protein [Rickettsia endosymbiont of Ixodes persulcatus]